MTDYKGGYYLEEDVTAVVPGSCLSYLKVAALCMKDRLFEKSVPKLLYLQLLQEATERKSFS